MMSNAIDFGVVDDSEEPAVYTTFATPISALARVNLVLHEHPVVKYKTITRVRGGDEPLLSGKKRGTAQRMNGILRDLWWSINMIGRCSICLLFRYRRWW